MKDKVYDLTFPQKNIWLMDKVCDNSSVNVITGIINLKNDFNINLCKEAINKIVKNNEAMRINIKVKFEKVCQIIRAYKYEDIRVVDMALLNSKEREDYIQKIADIGIDITSEKLYQFEILRYSDSTGCILLKIHHIISDAWSFSKIIEQFIDNYDSLKKCDSLENRTEIPNYTEFINSQKEYSLSEKYIKDEEYFKEYLKDFKASTSLKEEYKKISNSSKRYNIRLDKEINDKIIDFCKCNKISPYVLFLTVLSIYIYRIKNVNDVVIGTPVLNRSNFKEKRMLGLFMAMLPIRIKVEENMTALELAKSISSNTLCLFRHQKFPLNNIVSDIKKENKLNSLYNIVLSYQNARANFSNNDNYSTKWYSNNAQIEELQIHILDMDSTGILEINYDYLDSLFKEEEIRFLHLRLIQIIQSILEFENVNIDNIDILSNLEKIKLKEFNSTYRLYPTNKSVIDLFEEKVKLYPGKVALVFEDKKITYDVLNKKANIIANFLIKRGVKPNDIVSLLMKRSDKLIISILAILKCRAAYLTIDSNYPLNRINYILEDSNTKLVITDDNFIENGMFLREYINYSELIIDDESDNNLGIKFVPNCINYLMYTSGSTGNPKGVMVSCENLLNFVLGINEVIQISSNDNVASITTISFDIFGLELWLTLTIGATIILANDIECIDSEKLNNICIKNNATVIQTTPTKLKMLLSKTEYIRKMKKILLGGEKVHKEFVDRLKGITSALIYDVYGPTETTIWSTIQDVTNCIKVSAGRPISNTRIYIVDKKNRELPVGTSGQIAIAGNGVTIGYYNKMEATVKNYIYLDNLDERVYLTGDLGRINFDFTLEVLDRIDLQIKLNGQRIELEEIESNILLYDNIKDTVVVLKNNKFLACYYIKDNKNINIENNDISKFLLNKLPLYMIPTVYKEVDKFPLTLNGKIDRKALINIEDELINVIYEKPKTKLQSIVYSIWAKVLERNDFGINDKFFELNADSLDAIKVQIELLSYGIHLEYKELLKYQTIKELESYIVENKKEKKLELINKYNDFSDILNSNRLEVVEKIEKSDVKNILLTGVTGFLGIHILDSFMKSDSGKIYCIIREKDNSDTKTRLLDRLHYYFGNKYDLEIGKRIIIVDGSFVEENNFGVKEDEFKKLVSDVDLVIHSAACVKHYGDASYFKKVNIDGTENIVKFCYEYNKKLMHISTISISGNGFNTVNNSNDAKGIINFDETCFYQNQNLDNIYVYTKFKAEELVLEYMKKGLSANILRIGNLTGRYNDFKCQYNVYENSFLNKLKTFIKLGCFPKNNSDIYLEFTPVDLCSDAIIKIMRYFNMFHNMFHLYDNEYVHILKFIKILEEIGINIDIIDDDKFINIIEGVAHSKNNNILSGIINDLNENNLLNYKTNICVKCEYTCKYLESINFKWKKISDEYIIKYIDYLRKIGFLEK